MKKMKMTLAIAAATLVCSGALAADGQPGDDPIPQSAQNKLPAAEAGAAVVAQESANLSLIDKIFQYIRATDRGG